jgi:Legionella pneumophila major outer membrane protein precursor
MKNIMAGLFAVGATLATSPALAGQLEDISARLDTLERENAAIRKENTALHENKRLREHNASLKSVQVPRAAVLPAAPPVQVEATVPSIFDAMAADLPISYKAAAVAGPGQLRIWAEGGAIWSGGDPVSQDANLGTGFSFFGGGGVGGEPRTFDLTPKIGWEGATGFDYRFTGSSWHVSAQFRYGEGGRTSGAAAVSGTTDLAALGAPAGTTFGGSDSFSVDYKESHWLADLAMGRDVLGGGRDAMQVKGGLRVAEFLSQRNISDATSFFANLPGGGPFGGITSFSGTTGTVTDTRASFLGAGPVVGIQGAIPFAGNWSLDYLGDAGILFGTQQSTSSLTTTTVISPAILALLGGGGVTTTTAERFASVFSGDIQVGISYWVTPSVKVGASYRLDTLINVQNQSDPVVANITPDRCTHGPHLTVTGQF